MKHLTILVPAVQNNVITIAAVYEIFTCANAYWKETGRKELFTIELAGIHKEVDFVGGLFTAKPHVNITSITKTDLIIIPSVSSQHYQKAVDENKLLIDWVKQQYHKGAEIASLCTGAFMLASSGLLDGRICSTHWSAANEFRTMFPKVNLQADKLITDENGIYTNGGAYSFLNLAIYLVEKYYDRQTAIFCSKIFQIEIDRQKQSAFMIFKAQKLHGDELIRQVQEYRSTLAAYGLVLIFIVTRIKDLHNEVVQKKLCFAPIAVLLYNNKSPAYLPPGREFRSSIRQEHW